MEMYNRENPQSNLLKVESKQSFKSTEVGTGKVKKEPMIKGIDKEEWLSWSKEEQDKWYMYEL